MLVYAPPLVVPLAAQPHPVGPEALVEVEENVFVGPPVAIDEDGGLHIDFVEADEVLESILVPADQLLLGTDPTQCPVDVSDETVEVTPVTFDFITSPGIAVLTADGIFPGLLTDQALPDFDVTTLAEHTVYGFLYASAPVEISATDGGCVDEGATIEDSFDAGWNWLAWTVVLDETDDVSHVHATDVEAPDLVSLTMILPN